MKIPVVIGLTFNISFIILTKEEVTNFWFVALIIDKILGPQMSKPFSKLIVSFGAVNLMLRI